MDTGTTKSCQILVGPSISQGSTCRSVGYTYITLCVWVYVYIDTYIHVSTFKYMKFIARNWLMKLGSWLMKYDIHLVGKPSGGTGSKLSHIYKTPS